MDIVHLLRCHCSEATASLTGLQQDFVGDQIESFLFLALYIDRTRIAEEAIYARLVNRRTDTLAGLCHDLQQTYQLIWSGGRLTLPLS